MYVNEYLLSVIYMTTTFLFAFKEIYVAAAAGGVP